MSVSMPGRLQARVGKLKYVQLAAMTAAFQQFGRFHPLQIISRVDDAGMNLFSVSAQTNVNRPPVRFSFIS